MVACEKLFPNLVIYGWATNGTSWEFAKLEKNVFIQDEISYSLSADPHKIAGILNHILVYMKTDYSKFSDSDFDKQLKKYLAYQLLNSSNSKNAMNFLSNVNLVKITDIFDISYGTKFDLNKMTIISENEINDEQQTEGVAFISRTAKNLGITAYVEQVPNKNPYPSGYITVALGVSILSTFVQLQPFYTGQNIAVLKPKREIIFAEKLFYAMCIEKNKFRYTAFGREANRTLKTLLLPENMPDWIDERKVEKLIFDVEL